MPLFLTKFSYTPETWARLLDNPEDRRQAAQTCIESVGGRLHGFWYAFGPHDGYTLWEAPDNVSMAAVALALASGGALSPVETTVLLSVEETTEALGRAQQVRYRPPGRLRLPGASDPSVGRALTRGSDPGLTSPPRSEPSPGRPRTAHHALSGPLRDRLR